MIGVKAGRLLGNQVAHRTPQEASLCAKAKQQQQMFYLCESEATATNVLSVRKRSVSDKAQSERNQPHVLVMSFLSSKRIVNIRALPRRGRISAEEEQIASKTDEST
ncbi:hypothetical protein ACPCXF_04825 [Lysinibacillus agricola]